MCSASCGQEHSICSPRSFPAVAARYNAANPATAVMTGDIIESVNGATGDATAIKDAIKSARDTGRSSARPELYGGTSSTSQPCLDEHWETIEIDG